MTCATQTLHLLGWPQTFVTLVNMGRCRLVFACSIPPRATYPDVLPPFPNRVFQCNILRPPFPNLIIPSNYRPTKMASHTHILVLGDSHVGWPLRVPPLNATRLRRIRLAGYGTGCRHCLSRARRRHHRKDAEVRLAVRERPQPKRHHTHGGR